MSGQMIICPPVPFCPPPMPVCRPQPAPWSYTPSWPGCGCGSPYPQPGCGCGCPPTQPPPLFGPIMGVTDGSDAAPGQVGEFLSAVGSMAYAAYPQVTTVQLSPLVVPPGDWDVWAFMSLSTEFGAASFLQTNVPPQQSNLLSAFNQLSAAPTPTEEYNTIVCGVARGSYMVPSLLTFSVSVNQTTLSVLPGGNAVLQVNARRMR